jgi:hypothetical protein
LAETANLLCTGAGESIVSDMVQVWVRLYGDLKKNQDISAAIYNKFYLKIKIYSNKIKEKG